MGGLWIGKALGIAGMVVLVGCWEAPRSVAAPGVAHVAVVGVLPEAATVTVGKTKIFAARIDGEPTGNVAWSVLGPRGGTVDGAGQYRAPEVPGVYQVQAAWQGSAGTGRITVVAPPVGEIIAPRRVLAGAGDLTARIAKVPGSQYAWSISGGRILAGTDTPAVTFQAGTGPSVVLRCTVTNAAADALRTSLEVPVAAPVVLAISPVAVTVTAGRAMKFGFNLAGGTSLAVTWSLGEPGAGSLDGQGRYVAPGVSGTYTVRVASMDDPTAMAIAKVKVVPKPPESLFAPRDFLPGAAGLHATVPEVAGMTYAWTIEGGTITAGATGPAMDFTAGPGPALAVRCRITNAAGDSSAVEQVLKALD